MSTMRRRFELDDGEESPEGEETKRSRRKSKQNNNIYSVPCYVGIIFLLCLFGLFAIVCELDNWLPTALNIKDEETYPDAFITGRARVNLKALTDLGPRVAGGHVNENITIEYLKKEIDLIAKMAHSNHKLEVDTQVVSGAYYLSILSASRINSYSNLQNIVVKLHSSNNSNSSSLLVNAHFDSVPTSPGGSDDGINCAVMLEVLRKLTKKSDRPLHNIIFLFNGAEETGLQASHGFITQHKWAKECKVVINLEAAGAGGKIILFQSGPATPWLTKYYSKVPHPYGQAAGEEIFQSGIIPSDTDFRIFRDFGNLVGLDMAFFKNGYRYHTKYDGFTNIPLGSYQHAGDNTLFLVTNIANAPEMNEPIVQEYKMVFFDVFGFFMICYTNVTANIINYLTVALSLFIAAWSIYNFKLGYSIQTLKFLVFTFGALNVGWLLSGIFTAILAVVLDSAGYSMSWYANPWLVIGLYVLPTIAFSACLLPLVRSENLSDGIVCQIQAHASRLIWTLFLLVGTVLGIRTMYIFMIPVLFGSAAFLVIQLLKLQHSVRAWQYIYILFMIFPTMFSMYAGETMISLFIPVTGRMGSDKNPELIVGFLTMFLTILITSQLVVLVVLLKNFKYFIAFMVSIFFICFIIVFTPLGFPYNGNEISAAPERFWITHTQRVFHGRDGSETKRDSGYFLLNMDRNSPDKVKSYVKELSTAKSIKDDCETFLYCGMPLSHSRMGKIVKDSTTWIPAGPPLLPDPHIKFDWTKEEINSTVVRYNVSIIGPDRTTVFVSPKSEVEMIDINVINVAHYQNGVSWNERNVFFFMHIFGKELAPLEFSFDVKLSPKVVDRNITTEFLINGIYVHKEQNVFTPKYKEFLKQFPDWADVTPWLGKTESWLI